MTAVDVGTMERRSPPQRLCTVCMEGFYVTKPMSGTAAATAGLVRLPRTADGVLWHVEACGNCGHVLIFRRE